MGSRFKIILDPPYSMTDKKSHHFLPGDRVSGKVILTAKAGEKIKNISITLKGSFYSENKKTGGNLNWTYRFDIFKLAKTLLQGPVQMMASTYEYSFVIEIPKEYISPVEGWQGYPKPSDLYPPPPGPLWPTPPTCEDSTLLRDSYTDWSIRYSLDAKAKKSMLGLGDGLPIVITTCRPTLNPGPGPLRNEARDGFMQQYTFTNEGIPIALTKAETLKETIQHKAGNYRLNLSLLAAPTTAVIAGQPFTLAFTLQTNSLESDYKIPIPQCQLRDYTIVLCSATTVCVPLGKESHFGVAAMGRYDIIPAKRTVNAPLQLNKPVQMPETFPSSFQSVQSPPSFVTVLLERRYFFQITAHVTCLDHTTKLKILLPFWLHSPKMQEAQTVRPVQVKDRTHPPDPSAFPTAPGPPAATNTTQPAYHPPMQPRSSAPQPSLASMPPKTRRFCGSCGAPTTFPTANFCTECGTRV